MLDRVIVAFDGSDLSKEALAIAFGMARDAGLRLLVVHVVEPVPIVPPIGDPLLAFDPTPATMASPEEQVAARAERRATGEALLEGLTSKLRGASIECERRVVEGELIPALCSIASARDLLAIGRRGRFRPTGLGSATRSLVCKAPCPVMVVSEKAGSIGRVMGVFENTAASRRAVTLAGDLSRAAGWPLTIVACPGHGMDSAEATSAASAAAGDAEIVSLVAGQNEAEFIEQAAAGMDDMLLVMGAYADSWLHDLVFGDAAPRVIRSIGAPVVLAH